MTSFETRLSLSSVPLRKISADGLPSGIASGCLIAYGGKQLLLAVSHTTKTPGRWAIELRYEPGQGTQVFVLGAMHFLKKGSLTSSKLTDLDFSYVAVPESVRAYRQEISPPDTITSETPISVHTPNFADEPLTALQYGFCGSVKPTRENHPGVTYFSTELRICTGLAYLRSEDDYHVFKLPVPHEGHESFRGCSGAPVLDETGNLVGLVCCGSTETDEIWAFAIARYRAALDILVTEDCDDSL